MKKIFYLNLAFIFLLSIILVNTSIKAQIKEKLVKGEVVDILTYSSTGKSGVQYKETMLESSKKGNPLGILAGGKLYLVLSSDPGKKADEQLSPFLCLKVVAKGKVFTKGGMNVMILSNIDKDMKAK